MMKESSHDTAKFWSELSSTMPMLAFSSSILGLREIREGPLQSNTLDYP